MKIFFYFFFISFPNAFDMHRCNSRSCLRVRITSLNKFLIKFIWLFINMISFDVNKYVFYDCFDERCDHKYWGSRINHKKNQLTGILCHLPFTLWLIIMCINGYINEDTGLGVFSSYRLFEWNLTRILTRSLKCSFT